MMVYSLFRPLFGDDALESIFSDVHFVDQMIRFERALAEAEGRVGLIPQTAVSAIQAALPTFQVDDVALRDAVEKAGVPVAELVGQLRQHVGGEAATYLHWGATTQDVMDTAVMLQLRAALQEVESILTQTIQQLAVLADRHRHTLMAGRTHSQQALPITFGFKVAGWLTPLLRHKQRLQQLKPRLFILQFGGAVGNLSALGEKGTAVQRELAALLDLAVPPMAWHTQRDGLVECANLLSLVCGSLAKMAQDIILLAQSEVGELRETADPSRGGSSTMPQKSNPVISEGIIAIARSNANLVATLHQAQIQEQERGTHGWQMEWLALPQICITTAAALRKAHFLAQHIVIDADRMRQNIVASRGLMLAEPISLALSVSLGREAAKQLVKAACQIAHAEERHLVEVVRDMVGEKTAVVLDWERLSDEARYLGSTEQMIQRILEKAGKHSGNFSHPSATDSHQ